MYKKYTKLLGVPESYVRKLLLIMRLTTIIIIASLLQVSASTFSQTVTLKAKNAPLSQIIKEICAQTDYEFLYNKEILKNSKPVSIDVNNLPINDVLKKCFEDQSINYTVENRVVLLEKMRETTLLNKISAYLSNIDVHGTVVDDKGQPVAGANVRVKRGKGVVISDERGEFVIRGVEEGTRIVITYIGFNAKEVQAAKEMGSIKMELATSKLDEVVVQAYGKTSQRLSTGNISSITSAQIENKPVTNALLALQGEVPGIIVSQTTGNANSGIKIQLQGLNSMTQGNDPFYIIDGIPFISQLPANLNSVAGLSTPSKFIASTLSAASSNPLSFINPYDIESISILKGADATSIYGARAANGAILITTKKGRPGETKITVDLQQGISKYKKIDLLDRESYLKMRRDAYYGTDGLTDSSPEFSSQYDLNGVWDINRNTDWQKEVLGKSAHYSNSNLSISGGNLSDQYLLSANYHRENSIINKPELNDQKASFHVNLNHNSDDQRFKLTFTANYQYDYNKLPASDAVSSIYLAPVAPRILNDDGTINWQQDKDGNSTWSNIFTTLYGTKVYSKTENLISNLSLSYALSSTVSLRSTFGYSSLKQNEFSGVYTTLYAPEYRADVKASNTFNNSNTALWSAEPQLNYKRKLFVGTIDVVLGASLQVSHLDQMMINGNNYSNDILLEDIQSAGSVSGQTIKIPYKFASLFGRLNYNINDTYILNLSLRRDGSSKFGSNNLMHNFWSSGISWIFTNENFIKNNIAWLSFGKIRSSYGTTGSDAIPAYSYLNLYGPGFLGTPVPYQNTIALELGGLPNPNLKWEETKKIEFGIDLGFLNDRILFSSNYFRNRSSNQLLDYALPDITGASSYKTNFNALVQNSGLEFTLNTTNIRKSNFDWKTSFNLTSVKNVLVDFPGLNTSSYANSFIVGKSIALMKLYQYAGVNPNSGLYQFVASDGNLTSAPNSTRDRLAIADNIIKYSGGITNSFRFGRFDCSILFQFVKKEAQNMYAGLLPGYFSGVDGFGNQPAYINNYWTKPGDQALFQKVSATLADGRIYTAYSAVQQSTFTFGDASFIRFKNISFSYLLNPKVINGFGIKYCKLFINAQNLLTVTNFKGPDPEVGSANALGLPPLKTYVFGIQAQF